MEVQAALAAGGQIAVMGDQNQSGADICIEMKQLVNNLLAGLVIQVTGRLIREQDFGLAGEGTGDGDALLLTAGQLGRVMIQACAKAYLLQPVACLNIGILAPLNLQGQAHIVQCIQLGQQVERLENKADLLQPQLGASSVIQRIQRLAVKQNPPFRGGVQSRQQTQQGRFTGTRAADDGEAFTTMNL